MLLTPCILGMLKSESFYHARPRLREGKLRRESRKIIIKQWIPACAGMARRAKNSDFYTPILYYSFCTSYPSFFFMLFF
jgi:hypothetical protein